MRPLALLGVMSATSLLACFPDAATARQAAGQGHLNVTHDPPALSVEARGVGLPAVLRAIGAKVGFTVVDGGADRPHLTVSLTGKRLDEILEKLLRGENHVLLYREDAGGVAGGSQTASVRTIVLLGRSAARGDGREVDVDQGRGQEMSASSIATQPRPVSPGATASSAEVKGTSQTAAGEAASPEPWPTRPEQASMVHDAAPLGAPDPTTVEARILGDVRVMVDAARRATLNAQISSPTSSTGR